jgi:putative NADH-flavin reductase
MKVLVIGAAGKTGKLVVERALAAGHTVTAQVWEPEDAQKPSFPEAVHIVQGDAREASVLDSAIQGCEAVIDAIGGHTSFLKPELESATAKTILEAMQRARARRLIALSILAVPESRGEASFADEHLFQPTFHERAMKDQESAEAQVTESPVQWVLVHPPTIIDADATGSIKTIPDGETAHKITRADLAQFLVDQLLSDIYLGQIVTIANS